MKYKNGSKAEFRIINKKLDQISINMEKSKLIDYVFYLEHPRKMLLPNFLGGIARGFGSAVGFTILGALILYLLRWIVELNIPLIGDFISDIVNIVNENLRERQGW